MRSLPTVSLLAFCLIASFGCGKKNDSPGGGGGGGGTDHCNVLNFTGSPNASFSAAGSLTLL